MRPKTYCFLLHLSFHLHDEDKTENPRPHNQNCIFHWLSLQSYDFDAGKTQKTHHICRHSPHRKLSTIHRMMRNVYPVDSECLPTDLQYFLISVGPSPPTPGWDLHTIVNPPAKKTSSEMSLTLHYGKLTFCSSCGHEIALWPLFDRAETDITVLQRCTWTSLRICAEMKHLASPVCWSDSHEAGSKTEEKNM